MRTAPLASDRRVASRSPADRTERSEIVAIDGFALGARVVGKDGTHLGAIEKLIVHVATDRIGGFLLDRGRFAAPKIVETALVAHADAKGVALTLDAQAAEALPSYFHEQYQHAPNPPTGGTAPGGQMDAHGPGEGWAVRGPSGTLSQAGGGTPLLRAAVGDVETENVSNVPAEDVLVGAGTDVVAADGQKLGHLATVLVAGDGRMTGIVVTAGWLAKHELRVPLASVAGIAHDHIRLGVTSDEATRAPVAETGPPAAGGEPRVPHRPTHEGS
jgi:uncharacterized protein YrrD